MLLHEKMRLTRRQNELTYSALKASRKLKRVQDNIKNIQKIYDKRTTQLDSMKNIWTNQMKSAINQQYGVWNGTTFNGFSPYSTYGTSGSMIADMNSVFAGLFNNGNNPNAALQGLDNTQFQAMMSDYQANGCNQYALQNLQENGKPKWSQALLQGFQAVLNYTSQWTAMKQQGAAAAIQQMEMNMQNAIDEMKNQMEEEQEEALLPLKDQETEYELDKTNLEAEKETNKAALQNIDQELKEEAQNTAPKFGL